MYNWDEKGFIIGLAQTLKRIMTLGALKSGKIMGARQDGLREFISLLACICADGTKLPPVLIYKGESHDLLDSWVRDFNEGDQAYFASTKNGWSCDELGLQWLQKVFHLHTKNKAGNRRRLLIVDGHSSHVNLKFIKWADNHWIILLILPPHSTHRLQPLDVSLFSPLSSAYNNQINGLMNDGQGYVSMSKREFWPMFRASWETAFTVKNIQSGFAKTGIWPQNPRVVLDKIERPKPQAPLPALTNIEHTPMTCRSVRRMHKAFKKDPTSRRLSFIMHANIRLAAQTSIANHTISGLIRALKVEKRKRNRGKRLNLVGEEDNGPQLFSPSRVLQALTYSDEKEAQEQAERTRINTNKANALAKRIHKEQERAARALQASIRSQQAAEQKLQKASAIQARKDQRLATKQAREASKLQKASEIATSKLNQGPVLCRQSLVVAQVGRVANRVTSKGRAVIPPKKLST